MLADAPAAEDVVQDAFVAIWRHAAAFDPRRGNVRPWLLTTVRNRCLDILRGPRPTIGLDPDDADSRSVTAPDDVWFSVWQDVQAQDVRRALDHLPEEQRTTIQLAFFGGLTHTQIAAQMRVPLGTVKGRMRLALGKLRELLSAGELDPAPEG
jgi:RNA polymerase sigma-70 factor (ECF subfamily)